VLKSSTRFSRSACLTATESFSLRENGLFNTAFKFHAQDIGQKVAFTDKSIGFEVSTSAGSNFTF
jgi:hypothetical protein